jgi:apolipoprotein N-acyltransferase
LTDAQSPRRGRLFITLLTALLCGAASVTAFAPFGWWPVLIVTLGVFFALIYDSPSVRAATAVGYAFGLGLFGAGVHWIYYSLHLFGGAIAAVAAIGTAIFVVLLAILPAVFARLVRARKTAPVRWFLLLVPAAWLLLEWTKTWLLTGFPWLNIGYSTIASPLAGFAPVGGVLLSSLMLVLLAAGCGLVLTVRRVPVTIACLVLALAIFGGGFGLQQISWTQPDGQPLSVTMVQGNVAQENKFRDELLSESLAIYTDLSRSGADLVIWPETAVPTFFFEVDGYLDDFATAIARNGSTVLSGGFEVNAEGSEYYNAIKVLGGTDEQIYTKRHLVPFGEFIPFRGVLTMLADLITIPMSDLSPGRGPVKPIEIDGIHYGMSICYEDAFGAEMRVQLPLANVLVNVSNDAWFGDSMAPHQHLEMAAMRSLEFGRPMLRATNTGITAHISARGEILSRAPQFQQSAIDVEVIPRSGSTPYVRVGDWLAVGAAMLLLLLFFAIDQWFGRERANDYAGKDTAV